MKSGFVSIIGRPNVGKSTLLNSLINEKVAITSPKVQTTRNLIQGIYNDPNTQIVFVDTPGIHKPINKLGKVLNKKANSTIYDTDLILLLIDASTNIGSGDKFIIDCLKNTDVPVMLLINKIDLITKETLIMKINEYKDLYNFAEIVPISALTKNNVEYLVNIIKKYLKDNVRYFDSDIYTSNSKSFMVSEYVREKILYLTDDEVPHSVTCLTTKFEDKKDIVNINVDIIVDRDQLKKIIVGKDGLRIKQIGTLARTDIEKLLGKKIYLELYVKTIPKWRNKDRLIKELGFNDFE